MTTNVGPAPVRQWAQPPHDDLHCLMAGVSVFLGVTTMPNRQDPDFFKHMRGFLGRYRDELLNGLTACSPGDELESNKRENFRRLMYRPVPYTLFSRFDTAFLTLVDDFDFAVRQFHPFHPDWPDRNGYGSWSHRTILGPALRLRERPHSTLYDCDVIRLARQTFLRDPTPLPLIGICQLEVIDSLLIGGGNHFPHCLVKAIGSAFWQRFRRQKRDKVTHLILLGSSSWHELTLLLFGVSFADILDFVLQVRAMTLLDMGYYLRCGKGNLLEWEELLRQDNIFYLADKVARRQGRQPSKLLARTEIPGIAAQLERFAEEEEFSFNDPRYCDLLKDHLPLGTHVVFNTTTMLGYSSHLLEAANRGPAEYQRQLADAGICERDRVFLIREWATKAGHLESALKALAPGARNTCLVTSGRADMIHPCAVNGTNRWRRLTGRVARVLQLPGSLRLRSLSSGQVVESVIASNLALRAAQKAGEDQGKPPAQANEDIGILAVHSAVGYEPGYQVPVDRENLQGHSSNQLARQQFVFDWLWIGDLHKLLEKLRIPKVVAERVTHAVALYNDGIQDKFLFGSFLELRPYLDRIEHFLNEIPGWTRALPADQVCETLGQLVDNFEKGWRNRFHAGWRQGDVSDFNLEFKGGIQQLATAFNGAFRLLSWYFADDLDVLTIVTGRPGISTIGGALELNMFDIFKPEFFAARVGHEAAETILELSRARNGRIRLCNRLEPSAVAALYYPLLSWTTARPDPSQNRLIEQGLADAGIGPAPPGWLREILLPNGSKSGSFNQLYADICNFHTIYLGNEGLYCFWMLASFVVDPVNWANYDAVDLLQLREALLRMFLTMSGGRTLKSDTRLRLKNYWHELEDHGVPNISRYIDEAFDWSNRLLQVEDFRDWIGFATEFAINGVPLRERYESLGRFEAWRRQADPAYAGQAGPVPNSGLRWRSREILRILPLAYRCLRTGKAYISGRQRDRLRQYGEQPGVYPCEVDRWFDFCDVVALLHQYLVLLKNESLDNSPDPKRLIRHDATSSPIPDAKLLFDPRGGTFTCDHDFRRRYFTWRLTLIMSLYDIAQKAKFTQCREGM